MKWFFMVTAIIFMLGTVGERDKEQSFIYGVIAMLAMGLTYLSM